MADTVKWEDVQKRLNAIHPMDEDVVEFKAQLVNELVARRDAVGQDQIDKFIRQLSSSKMSEQLQVIFDILRSVGKTVAIAPANLSVDENAHVPPTVDIAAGCTEEVFV